MSNSKLSSRVSSVVTEYLDAFAAMSDPSFVSAVDRVLHLFNDARDNAATIYIAGNGGSASTASHWVNDLGKATKAAGRPPMRVMSLSDNVSWLTALGNDEGYHRVFSGQLENFARAGDVLIVISASGNSPNLVEAVKVARDCGVTTIAFLGFDGGVLKDMVDLPVWLPTNRGEYGLVESAHSLP